MTVKEFAHQLGMKVLTGECGLDKEVRGIYVCDLLSWVMTRATKGDAWITVLTNLNVIAVALLTEVACVIIPEGITVDEATLKRAENEDIAVLATDVGAYAICCYASRLLENK